MAYSTVKNRKFTIWLTFHSIVQIGCVLKILDIEVIRVTVVPQVVISYSTGHALT